MNHLASTVEALWANGIPIRIGKISNNYYYADSSLIHKVPSQELFLLSTTTRRLTDAPMLVLAFYELTTSRGMNFPMQKLSLSLQRYVYDIRLCFNWYCVMENILYQFLYFYFSFFIFRFTNRLEKNHYLQSMSCKECRKSFLVKI